ncbi:unnamed protein product [Trifolium pratense]|uniref:Uncharacterized protein n=1 Tax=Trifolium pratense TaxID=57577 RepID=A0ACB0IY03_TRIPR|nr:unnamed protein product [Trifolium pratense]
MIKEDGDQDSVVPFMGTRSLVNRLAEEIGFKTSQPYRTWFVGKRDQPEVDFQQFAGYITVDEINQRNLFYYFVESEVDPVSKPVVLWLNGGPGCSSIGQGAFTEHGPFQPTRKGGLVKNQYSWNRECEVDPVSKPVVLWLNGGPGCSSIGQGAFTEHGPFQPTRKGGLVKNQYSWNRGCRMESSIWGILTFATVRGAGGAAPATQPESSLVLFKAFLEGKPLPNNH